MKEKIREIIETELDILFNNYPDKNGAQLRLKNVVDKIDNLYNNTVMTRDNGTFGSDIYLNQKLEVTEDDVCIGDHTVHPSVFSIKNDIEDERADYNVKPVEFVDMNKEEAEIEDLEEHTEKRRGRKPKKL